MESSISRSLFKLPTFILKCFKNPLKIVYKFSHFQQKCKKNNSPFKIIYGLRMNTKISRALLPTTGGETV